MPASHRGEPPKRSSSSGRVTVNGEIAVVGQRVDPARDVLAVDGRPVGDAAAPVYLVLAKPAGVTSHGQRPARRSGR